MTDMPTAPEIPLEESESASSPYTISTIRNYSFDIEASKQRLKTLSEQLEEIVDGTPEHADILEIEKQLKNAKQRLRANLMSNQSYNDLCEEIGNEKEVQKSAKSILSDYLVAYHAETKERQIELNGVDTRAVILTGKLGRKQRYQTSMFAKGSGVLDAIPED